MIAFSYFMLSTIIVVQSMLIISLAFFRGCWNYWGG